ncbi:uncharacterized protein [Ptychodera flava]|uniref:uncharacterized protein n=1 Tax=Ptychodera flava TaxID=63121 RepID=UPI00396A602A
MADMDDKPEFDYSRKNCLDIPPFILKKETLFKLSMNLNDLDQIPAEIACMKGLQILELSNNKFAEFPEAICELVSLRHLDLAGNKLKSLPDSICKLKCLRKIWLGWNRFEEFPLQLCTPVLSELREIHISSNRLMQQLPGKISVLEGLEVLDVENCSFFNLPEVVCELHYLRFIKAANNNIQRLPNRLGESLPNLQILDLEGNPVRDPPLDICRKGIDAVKKYQYEKHPSDQRGISYPRSVSKYSKDTANTGGSDKAKSQRNKVSATGNHGKFAAKRREESGKKDLKRGEKSTTEIKPDDKKQVIEVSPEMRCEVRPRSVIQRTEVTTEKLEHIPETLNLSEGEVLESELYKVEIDESSFVKPPLVALEMEQGSDDHDKTRDKVIRSVQVDNHEKNVNLESWKEGNVLKAEMFSSSVVALVSKPKQYSFQLTNEDGLIVSCKNGDVWVDTRENDADSKRTKITTQLLKVDKDIAVRARELVEENGGEMFAMGTVLELQTNCDIPKPVTFELLLPVSFDRRYLSESGSSVKNMAGLRLLKDHGDDNWRDVTDNVESIQYKNECLAFTTVLDRGCSRFVVAHAGAGIQVEKTAKVATGMARRNSKIVKFLLLQNKDKPTNLYVDCVLADKYKERLEKITSDGFSKRSSLPYSRDIDLPEGEKVYLRVGGEEVRVRKHCEEYLTFYAKRDSFVQLSVVLDPSYTGDGSESFEGYVKFAKTKTGDEDGVVYSTLQFEIPVVKKAVQQYNHWHFNTAFEKLENGLLSDDIRPLARKLSLTDSEIDGIVYSNPQKKNEQIHQILSTWKERQGETASIESLLHTLQNLGKRNLAESLQRDISELPEQEVVPSARREKEIPPYHERKKPATSNQDTVIPIKQLPQGIGTSFKIQEPDKAYRMYRESDVRSAAASKGGKKFGRSTTAKNRGQWPQDTPYVSQRRGQRAVDRYKDNSPLMLGIQGKAGKY